MADEHGATTVGGVDTEIRALRQDVTGLKVDMAEVKGELRQMDKRLSNVESAVNGIRQEISKDSRQVMWTVLGTWIATMLTILFKH